jgi:hypothetical protein
MKPPKLSDVAAYVEQNIGIFHAKRILALEKLKLSSVLKRKNPYLFKAKALSTSEDIVKVLLDSHLSSNEETTFGDWLEGLAIYTNEKVYGGKKSGIAGIDLEFDLEGTRYIVSIKSGPNWGNSRQIAKMKTDFTKAKQALRTSSSGLKVVAVNGCCYGKNDKPDKGEYFKYCGQRFWNFISGDPDLYTEIIEPLGKNARSKNDEFYESYSKVINKFTAEFLKDFCKEDGAIDWHKIVVLNSGMKVFRNRES